MINEELARRAWGNVHMSDYKEGSCTASWLSSVEEAKKIINSNEIMTDEEKQYAIEKYKKKTAEWINSENRNNANHVSQFICGAGNYNMKNHERFLNREDKLMSQYDYIFNVDNYIKHKKIRNEIVQDIEAKEYEYNGITVIQNTDLNRLQLYFEDKPGENVRDILKANGFKWSPKNSTWQRQLTRNALMAFEIIKDKLN